MKIKLTRLLADIGNFPKLDIKFCLEKMLEAVPLMGMKVVGHDYSRDPDQAFVILATSHMSLHVINRRYKRFAFLDIVTCGPVDPRKGDNYLKKKLGFSNDSYKYLESN